MKSISRNQREQPQAAGRSPALRIVLYSHDTVGIGHTRRNLLIAQSLMGSASNASCLLIAGAPQISLFSVPQGIDCLTLPSISKEADGLYRSRSLGMPLDQILALRSATIQAAVEQFQPDVFIVDKVPRGLGGELDAALQSLAAGKKTRCVLGLRDILDHPNTVRQEWEAQANLQAIEDYYDAVWIYGDPRVYDAAAEYGFAGDVAGKVHYTGYFDHRERVDASIMHQVDPIAGLGLNGDRLVVCFVGGGQDGSRLADAFSRVHFPADTSAVLVTGPYMPLHERWQLQRRAAACSGLRVLEFVTEPEFLLSRADRVISMAGYNTIYEILAFDKPALVVPRVGPRQEQLIRAERLRDLGFVEMLNPLMLTADALEAWITQPLKPRPAVRQHIDFNGLKRLPLLLSETLVSRAADHSASRARTELRLLPIGSGVFLAASKYA